MVLFYFCFVSGCDWKSFLYRCAVSGFDILDIDNHDELEIDGIEMFPDIYNF